MICLVDSHTSLKYSITNLGLKAWEKIDYRVKGKDLSIHPQCDNCIVPLTLFYIFIFF